MKRCANDCGRYAWHFDTFLCGQCDPRSEARRLTGRQAARPRKQYPHGTVGSYRYGCRCDECRAANAEDKRRWRAGAA